jgi:hypothetical protein
MTVRALKRPKVSERPLSGLPTGPPAHAVLGGLSTAEVRWILPGQLDAAVAGWFARFPAGMESREDAYLLYPVLRGLSVKIRAGQVLEVKSYEGSLGIIDTAGCARGRIESWRKWSFPFGPLGPDVAGPPGWTVVRKRRWMSRFRLADGRLMAEVAERATGPECRVELTEVRSGGQTWWSLGFEATGPADLLRTTLEGTAALIFAQALPGDVQLDLSNSQSYAEWLVRRRVPAARETASGLMRHSGAARLGQAGGGRKRQPRQNRAIHPHEGEESPTRRGQDQSPSPDLRQ